jgi:cytochrome c5
MASFPKLVPSLLVAALLALPRPSPADDGEKIFQEACSSCHNAKEHPLDKVHLTREKWKDAIERMEGAGAEIPGGKKLDALLDYLVRTRGPEGAKPEGK